MTFVDPLPERDTPPFVWDGNEWTENLFSKERAEAILKDQGFYECLPANEAGWTKDLTGNAIRSWY